MNILKNTQVSSNLLTSIEGVHSQSIDMSKHFQNLKDLLNNGEKPPSCKHKRGNLVIPDEDGPTNNNPVMYMDRSYSWECNKCSKRLDLLVPDEYLFLGKTREEIIHPTGQNEVLVDSFTGNELSNGNIEDHYFRGYYPYIRVTRLGREHEYRVSSLTFSAGESDSIELSLFGQPRVCLVRCGASCVFFYTYLFGSSRVYARRLISFRYWRITQKSLKKILSKEVLVPSSTIHPDWHLSKNRESLQKLAKSTIQAGQFGRF